MEDVRVVCLAQPFYRLHGSHNNRIHFGLHYLAETLKRVGVKATVYNGDYLPGDTYADWHSIMANAWNWTRAVEKGDPVFAEIVQNVLELRPTHIVIASGEAVTPTLNNGTIGGATRLAAMFKSVDPTIRIIGYGPHFTFAESVSPLFDYVIKGEGENVIASIVMGGHAPWNVPGGLVPADQMDGLPFLEASTMDPRTPLAPHDMDYISGSRGCLFSCHYCPVPSFAGRTRYMSPKRYVDEMVHRYQAYGIRDLYLCLHPNTLVKMVGGFKPIDRVEIGEEVLAFDGEKEVSRRVTEVHRNPIHAPMYLLKGTGLFPMKVTENHPVAIRYKEPVRGQQGHGGLGSVEWVTPAQLVQDFMEKGKFGWRSSRKPYMGMTFRTEEIDVPEITDGKCELLGWYMAEGSIVADGRQVVWYLNINERDEADRIQALCLSEFGARAVQEEIEERGRTTNVRMVRCSSTKMADFIKKYVMGRNAREKHFAEAVMTLPLFKQQKIMFADMMGDGCVIPQGDGEVQTESRTTASRILALQLQEMYLRQGRLACVAESVAKTGYKPGAVRYRVDVFEQGDRCVMFESGTAWVPVRYIREISYEGDVCNLTVEGLHTYVTESGVVHNCDQTFTERKDRIQAMLEEMRCRAPWLTWWAEARIETLDPATYADLKKSGCKSLKIGIEAGDPEMLGWFGKKTDLEKAREKIRGLKDHGIRPVVYVLLGTPGVTRENYLRSYEYLRSLGASYYVVNITSPQRGTKMFTKVRPELEAAGLYSDGKEEGFGHISKEMREFWGLDDELVSQFLTLVKGEDKEDGHLRRYVRKVMELPYVPGPV